MEGIWNAAKAFNNEFRITSWVIHYDVGTFNGYTYLVVWSYVILISNVFIFTIAISILFLAYHICQPVTKDGKEHKLWLQYVV